MGDNQELPSSFYHTTKIDFAKPVDVANLKGKNIIVTGGANGIGAGCVAAFAEAGAYVSIFDINEEKGNQVADDLNKKGHHIQFIKTDIASYTSQLSAFKSALAFFPNNTLDIVLANAGLPANSFTTWFKDSASDPDADPEPPNTTVWDVNLKGLVHTSYLALHYFRKTAQQGDKSSKQLILVSSLAGYVAPRNAADYNSSKFGVRGFWKSIRYATTVIGEDAPPFRTNLIAPTFIRTAMTRDAEQMILDLGIDLGEVADVVAGVMRVACDESIYGRAMCTVARKEEPGDRNFDMGDDWEGWDAGRSVLEKVKDGTLKGLEKFI